MTLTEVGIITGELLEIKKVKNSFHVCFPRAEVKDGAFTIGVYGHGNTKIKAKKDYCKQIAGKRIVVNPYSQNREEFSLPLNITYK